MAKYNTVRLQIYGTPGVVLDYKAVSTIKTGMALSIDPVTGGVIPNPSTGLTTDMLSPKLISIANKYFGHGVSEYWNDPDENDYVTDDLVNVYHVRPGDKVWMWLAPGQTAEIGYPLYATGADDVTPWPGTLQAWQSVGFDTKFPWLIGHSEERVENTGAVPVRISTVIW